MNFFKVSTRTLVLFVMALLPASAADFVKLTDGKSFDGWKMAEENQNAWTIEDGAFKAKGARSHLFYVGDDKPFKNFHLRMEVKTSPNSNGGIFFHTKYQETGWPKFGFESQVNCTQGDWIKTGSLYGVVNIGLSASKDDQWWTQEIIVVDRTVTVKVDGKPVVQYTEPEGAKAGQAFTRKLAEGTFALQAHDPGSTVWYRNIEVMRLE